MIGKERYEMYYTPNSIKAYIRKGRKDKKRLKKHDIGFKYFDIGETIFYRWLEENTHRFTYKPKRINKWKYCFEGIIDSIYLEMQSGFDEATIQFELNEPDSGKCLQRAETVIEYVLIPTYNPLKGFYDADHVDGLYEYYLTYADMLINNVYEKIIEYVNDNFKPENSVYFDVFGDFGCSAFIGSSNEDEHEKLGQRADGFMMCPNNGDDETTKPIRYKLDLLETSKDHDE